VGHHAEGGVTAWRRPFRRLRAGAIEVALAEPEADVLRHLRSELLTVLDADGARQPQVWERLFPRAYLDATEEEAEREWQRLVHSDLLEGKRRALDVVSGSLEGGTTRRGRVSARLDPEEAHAWLTALTDVRLVLGTSLEITEDVDLASVDPADDRAPAYHLYGWLTWLQGELVETLMG
jgi:uncharacterized protein DUF2017